MKRKMKLFALAAVMLCVVFIILPVLEYPKLEPVTVTVHTDAAAVITDRANYAANKEKHNINGRININTASAEQLSLLSGIGQAKAEAIIMYRREHGKFTSPEELI